MSQSNGFDNKLTKIRVDYFNKKLSFSGLSKGDSSFVKSEWDNLRDIYTTWVADFGVNGKINNKSILNEMNWRGVSTWWLSPLSGKDFEYGVLLDQLMVLFLVKKYENNIEIYLDDKILSRAILINFPNQFVRLKDKKIKLRYVNIINLARSVLNVVHIYLLTRVYKKKQVRRYKDIGSSVWFSSSFPANWINNQDRHFQGAIDLDKSHGESAKYILYIYKYAKDKKIGFYQMYRRIFDLTTTSREVVLIEANIGVVDIASTYFSTLLEWVKFEKWVKNNSFNNL